MTKRKIKGGAVFNLPSVGGKPAISVDLNDNEAVKKLTEAQRRILMNMAVAQRVNLSRTPEQQAMFAQQFSADINEPKRNDNGTWIYPSWWSGSQVQDFKNKQYFIDWPVEFNRGKNEAMDKFKDEKASESDLLPMQTIPVELQQQVGLRSVDAAPGGKNYKYTFVAYNMGYNQGVKIRMQEQALQEKDEILQEKATEWEQEYEKGYMAGADEEDRTDKPWGESDPELRKLLYELNVLKTGVVPDPNSSPGMYLYNPYNYGYNKAPRKRKKDFGDYFIEGLTTPFKIASKIPGLNAIPGIKQAAQVGDVLQNLTAGSLENDFLSGPLQFA